MNTIDRCLAMGLKSSCALFEKFSSSLEWLATQHLHVSAVIHILDDFLFIPSSQIVLNELSQAALRKPDEEKPDENTIVPTAVNLDGEKVVKTLGIGWNPQTEILSFPVKETNILKLTKKAVRSNISRLYVQPPWLSLRCHNKRKDSVTGHLASEGV